MLLALELDMHDDTNDKTATLPTREEFDELVERAEAGDVDALRQLRATLHRHPKIWQQMGDLGKHVKVLLVDLISGKSILVRESLLLQLNDMEKSLSREPATPLEQLLVERVLVSWLDVNFQQISFNEPRDRKTDLTFWEQRLEKAQRRHFAAIEALERVRNSRVTSG